MKTKVLLTSILFLFIGFEASAQFYIKAGGGYGLPTSTSNFNFQDSIFHDLNYTVDFSQLPTTYLGETTFGNTGGGAHVGLTFGYGISENVAVELGIAGFIGAKNKIHSVTNVDLQPLATGLIVNTLDIAQSSTQIRAIPAIVVRSGNETFDPYARFGLLIPFIGQTDTEVDFVLENPIGDDSVSHVLAKTNGAFSLGFNSALGFEYHVSDLISIFAEFNLNSLSIQSEKTTIEELTWTVGSNPQVDATQLLPTSQLETQYVEELTGSSNNPVSNPEGFDPTQPLEDLRLRSQFGSIGLNAGITIHL